MWEIVWTTLMVIAIVLLPFALLYLRRRWLTGQGGLFDCAYQINEKTPGSGWVLGMGRYRGENLEWFRAFSLNLRPKRVFPRVATAYVHQRQPAGLEAIALFEDSMIVTVRDRFTGSTSSLSMARDEVLALMSWLESAPPGSNYLPTSADSPP
ncbi:DUF2550 domain-containing protein [Tessaracoccus sp. MC1865]|uniref:DUF2550 domain-containing protein n=1 Tax=unclassified Tessaracoccus TaxID=2635419 RepID=UPI001602A42D|nr:MULTISPECIES: DUF2550 domain-containing protein [unclassified Tessaracoccus]MBB1483449.1 DUF2550 domain-containing protein [Tessaracoccus sp. MC1865]MBB1509056.1 DUF2550 domain-containing protein [Tessaracoccus sp. MC1756]QTO36549.1 DUF2550 domain-containing protein [Tessaracoccus sp. MC1865]